MIAKCEFVQWLKTTEPPRRIKVARPTWYYKFFAVNCGTTKLGRHCGRTLAECATKKAASKAAAKYRRWLEEFESKR